MADNLACLPNPENAAHHCGPPLTCRIPEAEGVIPSWLRQYIVSGSRFADPDQLDLDSTFEDCGFDALAPIELDCLIEERTGHHADADDVENWNTLRDVLATEQQSRRKVAA